MQPQAPQQAQNTTLRQRLEMAQWLACFPALSITVMLRRDIGYRVLHPLGLTAIAAVMFVIAGMISPANRPQDLQVFAALVLALGLFQRFLRWQEFSQGVSQHSRYIGTSCFDAAFMPDFFRRERRLARFLDPIVCGAIGLVLLPYSPALALWLIFAALCLRLVEFAAYRMLLHDRLDMVDGLSFSEFQGETVEHFTEGTNRSLLPQAPSSGIPTGLGADIERKIARGKANATPLERPAPTTGVASLLKQKPKLTRGTIVLAFLIAVFADGLHFLLHYVIAPAANNGFVSLLMPQLSPQTHSVEFAIDCVAMTATVLLLGFHWALLPSVFVQFIPGVPRIPTWIGCVAFVVWQRRRESSSEGTDNAPNAGATHEPPTESRLTRLTELHRRGLITDDEYQTKRRVILDEL